MLIQSYPTLCNPMDCRPPSLSMGFSKQEYWSGLPRPPPGDLPNPGIEPMSPALQADSLLTELQGKPILILLLLLLLSHFSRVRIFVTLWTVAHQAPQSMGFSRQGYWSGLPRPPPGDLPNPGIKPRSPTLQAGSLPSETQGKPLY